MKPSSLLPEQCSTKSPCQCVNWRMVATGGNAVSIKCGGNYQLVLTTDSTTGAVSLVMSYEMPFWSNPPPSSNSPGTWLTISGPLQRTGSSWALTNKVTWFYWAFADAHLFCLRNWQLFKSCECQAALMLVRLGRKTPLLVPCPWWLYQKAATC